MPALSLDVPAELVKDPGSWTVEDVCVWLRWLGIEQHVESFTAQNVDGQALLRVSADNSWADLGVVDPAQQRVLDSAAEPLRVFRDTEGHEVVLALHAVEGPLAGEVIMVGPSGITGGRHSTSNGIVLSENYVSRRHFEITSDAPGHNLLQDVGSTTGTFLMVREEMPLENGMVLQLGMTELTVAIDGAVCTVLATEGPAKDATATVQGQGMRIGRDLGNGLVVRDAQISAFHAEIRYCPERGFVLEDRYSTNRSWLRLGPDGRPSKQYEITFGDVFKVGSTLFHVLDPATLPPDGEGPPIGEEPPPPALVGNPAQMPPYEDPSDPEYSEAPSSGSHPDGMRASNVHSRELSSLQQGMRNTRAQTAYTLEQRRPRERRDEDMCKICYDNDIEVVLYPCGHYILCRWCACKVSDCPVCRVVIAQVIRTYKA
eukprot:TRINITY_DN9386_c0_g1_i1.p1 TRINITY_DN9386_c0_g1~~TRINITY_DN9386_c0_g1_i1.p1  ORF type:complete len:430 (+),score=87.22 TRINITY_DN9386_c0_g1_i1:98-1387(+)